MAEDVLPIRTGRDILADLVESGRQAGEGLSGRASLRGQAEDRDHVVAVDRAAKLEGVVAVDRLLHNRQVEDLRIRERAGDVVTGLRVESEGRELPGAAGTLAMAEDVLPVRAGRDLLADLIESGRQAAEGLSGRAPLRGQAEDRDHVVAVDRAAKLEGVVASHRLLDNRQVENLRRRGRGGGGGRVRRRGRWRRRLHVEVGVVHFRPRVQQNDRGGRRLHRARLGDRRYAYHALRRDHFDLVVFEAEVLLDVEVVETADIGRHRFQMAARRGFAIVPAVQGQHHVLQRRRPLALAVPADPRRGRTLADIAAEAPGRAVHGNALCGDVGINLAVIDLKLEAVRAAIVRIGGVSECPCIGVDAAQRTMGWLRCTLEAQWIVVIVTGFQIGRHRRVGVSGCHWIEARHPIAVLHALQRAVVPIGQIRERRALIPIESPIGRQARFGGGVLDGAAAVLGDLRLCAGAVPHPHLVDLPVEEPGSAVVGAGAVVGSADAEGFARVLGQVDAAFAGNLHAIHVHPDRAAAVGDGQVCPLIELDSGTLERVPGATASSPELPFAAVARVHVPAFGAAGSGRIARAEGCLEAAVVARVEPALDGEAVGVEGGGVGRLHEFVLSVEVQGLAETGHRRIVDGDIGEIEGSGAAQVAAGVGVDGVAAHHAIGRHRLAGVAAADRGCVGGGRQAGAAAGGGEDHLAAVHRLVEIAADRHDQRIGEVGVDFGRLPAAAACAQREAAGLEGADVTAAHPGHAALIGGGAGGIAGVDGRGARQQGHGLRGAAVVAEGG